MSKVTVYYFKGFDIKAGEKIRSKKMATLEWIKENNFAAITETKKEVDLKELDGNGLYQENQ